MRAVAALLLPLLVVLAAIAWGATEVVERTGRRWFDRESQKRAELLVGGAQNTLAASLRQGDRAKARQLDLGPLPRRAGERSRALRRRRCAPGEHVRAPGVHRLQERAREGPRRGANRSWLGLRGARAGRSGPRERSANLRRGGPARLCRGGAGHGGGAPAGARDALVSLDRLRPGGAGRGGGRHPRGPLFLAVLDPRAAAGALGRAAPARRQAHPAAVAAVPAVALRREGPRG